MFDLQHYRLLRRYHGRVISFTNAIHPAAWYGGCAIIGFTLGLIL